ncbi:MAG: neutral/alkaline non-lysosomal ceramidase N-terminal domain-containing protein, partial [Planctomycetaceae bacterium]|nr:neutral/alkaline non-lysosomal ceramidase N-terminal domain-containing protein [Planctomycetaceae bacterium]
MKSWRVKSPAWSVYCLLCIVCLWNGGVCFADGGMRFGFGKRDITPTEPMRLSGYSNRTVPAKDAYEKLNVRSMVMRGEGGETYAIVSIDLLGLSASQNAEIARRVEAAHQIPRERLVVSCTHTHTGPQLTEPASNLLSTPFTEGETACALAYAERLTQEITAVIGDGIADLKPGRMFLGEGKATFAMNRRKLVDGKYVMVANPEGAVDHSLPVLKITDEGGKVRGLVFNYACHATTLGPNDNQYNPDWPGFAAKFLEEAYPGAMALSLIGCGADANPEPRSRKDLDAVAASIGHGRAAAKGVKEGLEGKLTEIKGSPVCSFGFAGIAFDLPSREELTLRLTEQNVTIRQHAANMLEILKQKRMLPSSYPLPLQTWQFGDELTMVFMGGEVVVDYALRLKKELKPGYVWVSAYTNDDPGYIASERVRSEGGYEVDYSMFFYNQPGRWATGTEELIIERIKALRDNPQAERARNPDESALLMHLPQGFRIEAVATEPLVMDPVNFAFGPDGKLWVVEMADYPLGEDGKSIGRVVYLEDDDRDGKFDRRTVFLTGLEYPTGVFPWKEGVIVSAAPEIFFVKDTNGDG